MNLMLRFRPRLRRTVPVYPRQHFVLWLDGQDRPVVVPGPRGGRGERVHPAATGDHLQPLGLRAVPGGGLWAKLGRQRRKVG